MVSTDSGGDLGCHECGRAMAKAKKVHNHCRYCETCYARLFKPRLCPGCGNSARLPVFDQKVCCSACNRAKPCVRCSKIEFAIGMWSDYGPVCKPCVPYFREPEVCETCGKVSQRLAVSTKTGRRSCNKCREPAKATCASCRRHRELITDADGVSRCKVCISEGERKCGTCGSEMPAGRGQCCESCSWTAVFVKRTAQNSAGFSSPRIQQHFEVFSQWLLNRSGPHKAALSINKHYRFFAHMDALWGDVPTYDLLLKHVGAAGLRKAENPMRWLQGIGAVTVSDEAREVHTERRRLVEMLSVLPDFWSNQLLHGYHDYLAVRVENNETDLRSMRLAMRSALNFLKLAALAPQALPTQKTMEAFWRSSPGQVAAVSGFVGYLNKTRSASIKARPEKRWLEQARKHKAERELVELLKHDAQDLNETVWIVKGMAYFHEVYRANRKKLVYREESFNGMAGFAVKHEGETLWIPSANTYRGERDIKQFP